MASSDPTIIEAESGAIAAVSKTPPDEARNKRRTDAYLDLARSFKIETQDDYELAAGELRKIKTLWTNLEDERTSFTKPLNDVLDRLNARFQPYLKALCGDGKKTTESAESILKGKMAAYLAEQERIAAEARRKAEEIAAAERQRLAAEAAETRRKAEEAAAQERRAEEERQAELRRQQAAAEAQAAQARSKKAREEAEVRAKALQEQQAREAQEAEQRRAAAAEQAESQAQALEQTAAVVIAQPIAVAPVKVKGISTVKTMDYRITDMKALATHIVTVRPDLLHILLHDEVKMRALVRAMGQNLNLPGIEVFEKTGIAAR